MARKKKHEDHINHERWLVSYADFITLLFAFFVVMFSVSQVDTAKLGKFSESFIESMGVHLLNGSAGVFDGTNSPFQWIKPGGKKGPASDFPPSLAELQSDMSKAAADLGQGPGPGSGIGLGKAATQVKTDERAVGEAPSESDLGLRVLRRRSELVLRLDIDVLFQSGSDAVHPRALELLATIGRVLKEKPVVIRVEGHTDDRPISTTRFRSNWHLSTARATAVIQYFAETIGIPPARLGAAGYGEFQPVASNSTEEGRAKNRRVDVVLATMPEAEPVQPAAADAAGTDAASDERRHGESL